MLDFDSEQEEAKTGINQKRAKVTVIPKSSIKLNLSQQQTHSPKTSNPHLKPEFSFHFNAFKKSDALSDLTSPVRVIKIKRVRNNSNDY
jgi:hypothetical protein